MTLPGMSTVTAAGTGTLLGVWAHPDDESYLSGALMASAVAAGDRVVVATATRGELGATDPAAWPPHRLAARRAREMGAALRALGVREHHWLGHTDGTLPAVPAAGPVDQVMDLIERVRPDTIVTFGPDGVTGHEDHRAVGAWTTAAWHALGRPGRLWYAALDEQFHREWGGLAARLGLWMTPHPPAPADGGALVHQVHAEEALLVAKLAAIRAHASQSSGLIAAVGEPTFRRWWAVESFVAAPACAGAGLTAVPAGLPAAPAGATAAAG